MDKIELAIQQIMANVFTVPLEQITVESTQNQIDAWDSLKHLNLVVALEEEFDITFPVEEIGSLISFKLIKVIINEQLQKDGKTY
jgi:acyl carrier protein